MPQSRRRWFTAGLGALVMVVLAGGVVSATSMEGPSATADGRARTAGGSISEVSPERAATSTTTAVSPSPSTTSTTTPGRPTTTRPAPTVTSRPTTTTVAPAGTGSVVRSTRTGYGTYPPGTVEVPFSPGQTVWSGVSNGVTITVRSDIARPRTGEIIRFQVELSSSTTGCCDFRILNGDGGQYYEPGPERCSTPAGFTSRYETRHAYNLDGRWTFNVSGHSGGCGGPTVPNGGGGELFGTIEVAAGVTTAQGPFPPNVLVDSTVQPKGHENDYSWVSIAGYVEDVDGWMRRLIVDWGDGTPATVVPQHPGVTCDPHPVTGWPGAGRMIVATGSTSHHYAAAGTYTVTIVGVSTACDGTSEAQQGTKTFRWQAPAPA